MGKVAAEVRGGVIVDQRAIIDVDAAVAAAGITIFVEGPGGREAIDPQILTNDVPPGLRRFGVDLPSRSLSAVRVFTPDRGEATYGAGYFLLDLLPEPWPGHLPTFFINSKRPGDVGVIRFIVKQMIRDDAYDLRVKMESAKILGYGAVEAVDPVWLADAIHTLDEMIQLGQCIEGEIHKGSSKFHPVHRLASLHFTRALCRLADGRLREGIDDLKAVASARGQVAKVPVTAVNLACALCLLAWIYLRAGDMERAKACCDQAIEAFRTASQSMPAAKTKLFADLRISLEGAMFAIDQLAGMKQGTLTPERPRPALSVSTRFSRMRGERGIEAVAQAIERAAALIAT